MFSSYYMDRDGYVSPNKHTPNDVPVAVIPFEDREQVERLADIYGYGGSRGQFVRRLTDALREFANPTPPKPKPLLDRLKERAPDGLIDPALAEQVVKEWLAGNAEEMTP